MSFKRSIEPAHYNKGNALTQDMVGIGMKLGLHGSRNPNIEDTLVAASLEGILKPDGRVMAVLVTWIGVHFERINVARLISLVEALDQQKYTKVRHFWCAIGQWLSKDPRCKKLSRLYRGPRVNFYDGSDFLIKRNGEDERFQNTCLRVPKKSFRHRLEDVRTPRSLAKIHLPYRLRVVMGPSYRADMWAYLREHPYVTNAELARRCYGSYRTACLVKRDYAIAKKTIGDSKKAA